MVEPIDRTFFLRRLSAANRAPRTRGPEFERVPDGLVRGDLLPGLIVDRYGPHLVVQLLDQGMDRARGLIESSCGNFLRQPAFSRETMPAFASWKA